MDFHTNKRIVDEVAITPSKRMRNKIAGFTTHLMKRIAKGPVRGISLKLQEEERERRLDFVPEVSALGRRRFRSTLTQGIFWKNWDMVASMVWLLTQLVTVPETTR